ncbi:MAG: hypothetical protein Q7R82_00250 [Candidatus Daviesbacteria bacterium]|nr:hypothetical protein [Candidatus Daviesbacteria bacterium]
MKQLDRVEAGTISWVDENYPAIAPLVEPLELEGFRITPYLTFTQAWEDKEEIAKSRLLLIALDLPTGRMQINQDGFVGLTLLKHLRSEDVQAPAVFLTFKGTAFGGTALTETRLTSTLMRQLDASLVPLPALPSQLRNHVHDRLALP